MGIENNTREIETQNQELQRANREQIEQANKEHEELGKVLDGLDTLDNEAELDEISGNEDISEQDDVASQLDNNDKIEDETSEQFETINNPVYNEVENNGFGINDVNQAVDAKEAYEAEIRDMSQDEYHDQKELDQRVEENGSEPNMTELSVLDNDLHQGDVSNKETDNRSRLNEPEQNAVDMERSTEEIPGNDETVGEREVDQKNDISNEVKDSLENFNQERWERMSPEEQKEAITELRDCVATDLELDNKPEVKFYDVPDSTDFGGYSAKENAIYINEYNMGDARETADTIAHESRHCWQHERAENPQTEQDYEFKENFEDYVSPSDDYQEYKNQPVEVDAKQYATEVCQNIDEYGESFSKENIEGVSEGNAESFSNLSPERGAVFDSRPEDLESKVEVLPISKKASEKCEEAGLSTDRVQEIREIPNGDKPNPEEYLSNDYIDNHLSKFDETGCYKIISDKRGEPSGTIGEESVFVLNGEDVDKMIDEANGDPRKLEEALAMKTGYLGDNPYIIRCDKPHNLRMATGNEPNAWQDEWCLCGVTRDGTNEAVIDQMEKGDYSFKHVFGDDEWRK